MVKRNLHDLRQPGSRERASLYLCKIRGKTSSREERVLGAGTVGRFYLIWVKVGLGKPSPSTERRGMGEGIGVKKEHGWKVM